MAMPVILEKPTVDAVRSADKNFDKENKIIEDALTGLFEHYPKNTKTSDVLLKVLTLNALYSTQIPLYSDRIPTVWKVVDHIVKLGIDPALERGSPDLVFSIARIEIDNNNVHFNYSFATKYCNWHKPEFYPIYDSRVDEYLWQLQNQHYIDHFERQDLKKYLIFKETVTKFRDSFLPERFTYKEIDKFLYYEGGNLLVAMEKKKQTASTSEPNRA
jgi:hypothetical protein